MCGPDWFSASQNCDFAGLFMFRCAGATGLDDGALRLQRSANSRRQGAGFMSSPRLADPFYSRGTGAARLLGAILNPPLVFVR